MQCGLALGLLLVAAIAGPVAAQADTGATLYVDQGNPNCSNTGAGTAAQPFCTISAAAANTAAGTTVVVSTGTYSEEVKPPTSGASGSPVTFTVAPGGNVVVTGAPPGNAGKPAFYINNRSWITIRGFTVTTGDKGIYVVGSSNITITDNHVTGCAHQGIQLNGSTGSHVEDNTVDHDASGVWLNATTQTSISGNAISGMTAIGIELYGLANDNTLSANIIHDTYRAIRSEYSTDNLIVNNAISNPAGSSPSNATGYAIQLYLDDYTPPVSCSGQTCPPPPPDPPTLGTRILANSIAQSAPAPAVDIAQSTNTTLANNIIDVVNPSGGVAVRVDSTSTAGTSLDYDQLDALAGKLVFWNGSSYASLVKFTAAAGQEVHGIQGPAGFADPGSDNLSLLPGSKAVDSAFSGPLNTLAGLFVLPAADAFGGGRVDDGATPNTGAGTISFADRGAYEMHNPGFEANTAGWNTSGSSPGVTLSQVAGGHSGSGAALLTNTGTTAATCALNDSPNIVHTTTAGTYTGTLWVWSDKPGATLNLRLREWAGNTSVGQATTVVTLTSQWQLVTAQYTAVDPGASTLDFSAYVLKASPGTCFYADDASVAVG